MLPNRLKSGDRIVTKSGHECTIMVTGKTDEFSQPLYRLRHAPRTPGRPGVAGKLLISRDELQAQGCTLATEGDG